MNLVYLFSVLAVFLASIVVTPVNAQDELIPDWVKTTVGLWSDDFRMVIEWLIDNGILKVQSFSDDVKQPGSQKYVPEGFVVPDNFYSTTVRQSGSQKYVPEEYEIETTYSYDMIPSVSNQEITYSYDMIPSVSNQEITYSYDMIPSVSNQEITYSYDMIPSVSNQEIVKHGMYKGISAWQESNPDLKFIQVENNADLLIHWHVIADSSHFDGDYVGFAETHGFDGKGDIFIVLGAFDCKNNFVQYNIDRISDTVSHEIGHILGFDHILDESHLMYGTNPPIVDNFESMKYIVPASLDGSFVGYDELERQYDELQRQYDELQIFADHSDIEIQTVQLQYDELVDEYEKYDDIPNQSTQYWNALNLLYEELEVIRISLNEQIDIHNSFIKDMNIIHDDMSIIIDEMNCYAYEN